MADQGRHVVLDELVAVLEEQVTELEALSHQRALLRRARVVAAVVRAQPDEAAMIEPAVQALVQEVLSGRRSPPGEDGIRGRELESLLGAWDAAMQELRGTLASLEHRLERLEHAERS